MGWPIPTFTELAVTIGSTTGTVTPAVSANFRTSYLKLCEPNLTQRDRDIFLILALIQNLSNSSINYSNHANAIRDAEGLFSGVSHPLLRNTLCLAMVQNGPSLDVASLKSLGKDFYALTDELLEKILGLLFERQLYG